MRKADIVNEYLRSFGTFQITKRAEKSTRNFTRKTTINITAHNIPAFKLAKEFAAKVKTKVTVK